MEESYDVIVLGTGLTECIISGLLSVEGKKVLHLDTNNYYGGECASLNLTQLYEKFGKSGAPSESFGRPRDYNIDLVPKFSMSAGDFVQMLVYTDVTKYFKFKQIEGSYVYQNGKIVKVPATEKEALTTSIFSLSEKNNLRKLFEFIQKYNIDDPSTTDGLDWEKVPMKEVYQKFNLESSTCDLCGHALALYFDDDYLEKPFKETFQKIVLYMNSVIRYGKSPFI
jgi:Rab GDP dissociation inhibitor